jgi:hypothetical protein
MERLFCQKRLKKATSPENPSPLSVKKEISLAAGFRRHEAMDGDGVIVEQYRKIQAAMSLTGRLTGGDCKRKKAPRGVGCAAGFPLSGTRCGFSSDVLASKSTFPKEKTFPPV